jgi:hypothetical protein
VQAPVRSCARAAHPAVPRTAADEAARTPEGAGQRMPVGTNLARSDEALRAAG